jgi:N-hydroxyarylamine O-acetyltransferase
MTASTTFTSAQIATFLDRIGYTGPTEPTVATLEGIYRAHQVSVPFENFDILPLGRPLQLEAKAIFDKIVGHHRGGYCYELNGLLATVLRDLGYQVTIAEARFVEAGGGLSAEFDHMVLIVQPPGDSDRWLVDAAGGRNASIRPLPIRDGYIEHQPEVGRRFSLSGHDRRWQLDHQPSGEDWQPIYVFDAIPRTLDDFRERSDFHEQDPSSHFRQGPLCTIATPTGRVTFSQNRLIITDGADREERSVAPDEVVELLRRYFQVDLELESASNRLAS